MMHRLIAVFISLWTIIAFVCHAPHRLIVVLFFCLHRLIDCCLFFPASEGSCPIAAIPTCATYTGSLLLADNNYQLLLLQKAELLISASLESRKGFC